jgi:hypothetical protein
MKMRLNDVIVNEQPKFLSSKPREEDQTFIFDKLIIPLELEGLTSYFPARKPSQQAFNNADQMKLTYPDPKLSPNDISFSEEENCFVHMMMEP